MEPASDKLMCVNPRSGGVFPREFIPDTGILGTFMGRMTLLVFLPRGLCARWSVPLSAVIPPHGENCSKAYSAECDVAYRAVRAAFVAFVTRCVLLLVHAINCPFPRRSLFYYKWAEAKLLLWAIVVGAVMIVPLPYIPLRYEWGYVVASAVVFMAFSEVYKLVKRRVMPKERVLPKGHTIGGYRAVVEDEEVEVDAQDDEAEATLV